MSVGLEALKEYRSQQQGVNVYADKYLDIIEKELKELEERREMMKRFNDACVPTILDNETEKKLKALEIIKTKKVDTFSLRKLTLEEYNYGVKLGKKNILVYECELITPEEYDLLKEVLQ